MGGCTRLVLLDRHLVSEICEIYIKKDTRHIFPFTLLNLASCHRIVTLRVVAGICMQEVWLDGGGGWMDG